MEPLAIHENSQVDIVLNTDKISQHTSLYEDAKLNEIQEKIKKYRPYASEWVISFAYKTKTLEIYGDMPVTDLIYQWLEEDLKSIYWIKWQCEN